jgi:DNA-binding response OmpR family regulator
MSTQVMLLRKKTEPDPCNSRLIKTVRGSGYAFASATVGITLLSTRSISGIV